MAPGNESFVPLTAWRRLFYGNHLAIKHWSAARAYCAIVGRAFPKPDARFAGLGVTPRRAEWRA
jgi:hypothetical protein